MYYLFVWQESGGCRVIGLFLKFLFRPIVLCVFFSASTILFYVLCLWSVSWRQKWEGLHHCHSCLRLLSFWVLLNLHLNFRNSYLVHLWKMSLIFWWGLEWICRLLRRANSSHLWIWEEFLSFFSPLFTSFFSGLSLLQQVSSSLGNFSLRFVPVSAF